MKFSRYVMLFLGILVMSQLKAQLWDFESPGIINTDYPYAWYSSDASNQNLPWCGMPEPANGGNYFLLLDKGNLNGTTYRGWYDNVTVTYGTTYSFSFIVRNVKNDPNKPVIVFRVNGVRQTLNGGGTSLTLPYNANCNEWITVTGSWVSNVTGTVQIDISSDLNSFAGNDFAIDNVFVTPNALPCTATIDPMGPYCNTDTNDFTIQVNNTCSGGYLACTTANVIAGTFNPGTAGIGTHTIKYIHNSTVIDQIYVVVKACCVYDPLEMAFGNDTVTSYEVEEVNSVKYHRECGYVMVGNEHDQTNTTPRFLRYTDVGGLQIAQDYIIAGPFYSDQGDLKNVELFDKHSGPEFVTCGWFENTSSPTKGKDFVIMHLMPGGEPIISFISDYDQDDYLNDIEVLDDGTNVAVGYADQVSGIMVTRFAPGGGPIWANTYSGLLNPNYTYEAFAVEPTDDDGDGIAMDGLIIAGYVGDAQNGSQTWSDIYLLKLDMSGNIMWDAVISLPYKEVARSIVQVKDASGNFIPDRFELTGYAEQPNLSGLQKDAFLLGFDASAMNYTIHYITNSLNDDEGYAIEQKDYQTFIIAGELDDQTQKDALLIEIDIAGNLIYTNIFGDMYNDDYARSLDIHDTIQGSVFAGATSNFINNATGNLNFFLAKADANGHTNCELDYTMGISTVTDIAKSDDLQIDAISPVDADIKPIPIEIKHHKYCESDTVICNVIIDDHPDTICSDHSGIILGGIPTGGVFSGAGVVYTGGNYWFIPNGLTTGSYTITYTVTGCPPVSVSIYVCEAPTVYITPGDTTICESDGSITLYGTPSGGIFSGTGVTSGGIFNPSGLGGSTYEIVYTYYECSCVGRDTIYVTVLTQQTASINPIQDTICSDDPAIPLTGNLTDGVFSGTGVQYSGGNYWFNPSGLATGLYTLSYTGPCADTATVSIYVCETPQVSISPGDTTICESDGPITLYGTPFGGTFSGTGVSLGGTFDPTGLGGNTYEIIYEYGICSACPGSDTIYITVNSPQTGIISNNPDTLCINSPAVTLTGIPTGGSFSGTGITSGGYFDPALAGTGSHVITYNAPCATPAVVTIVVESFVYTDIINNDTTICEADGPITLTATPSGGSFEGIGISPSGVFDPAGLGGTLVTIKYIYNSICSDTSSIQIDVIASVTANITTPSDTICVGTPTPIIGTPTGGNWYYTLNGGTMLGFSGTLTPSSPGLYKVFYVVGTLPCQDTATQDFVAIDCCTYNPFETILGADSITDYHIEEFLSVKYLNECGYVAVGNDHENGVYHPILIDFDNIGTPVNRAVYNIMNPFNSDEGSLNNVETTTDGGYITCGWMMDDGSGTMGLEQPTPQSGIMQDFYVLKTDQYGSPLWSYVSNRSENDWLSDIEELYNGEYVAAGYVDLNSSIVVTAYDQGGGHLWTYTYDDAQTPANVLEGYAIEAVDDDGDGVRNDGYIVAGYIGDALNGTQGWSDIYLLRLDQGGNLIWDAQIVTSNIDVARSIVQVKDANGDLIQDRYMLTGYEMNGGQKDVCIVEFDGNSMAYTYHTLASNEDEDAYAIEQYRDLEYVVVGEVFNSIVNTNDAFGIKYDVSQMSILNSNKYGNQQFEDYARSLEIDPTTGGYVIAGSSTAHIYSVPNNLNYLLLQTDANGRDSCENSYSLTTNDVQNYGLNLNANQGDFEPEIVDSDRNGIKLFQDYCVLPTKSKRLAAPIEDESRDVNVYPVPVNGNEVLMIDFEVSTTETVRIRVMNLVGELIIDKLVEPVEGQNSYQIELNGVSSGTYILNVHSKELNHSKKIIILK